MALPSMDLSPGAELGRHVVVRKLGEGGMGVVYEATDTADGKRVALKTLRGVDGQALYRFKQEFRSLADVIHPNLVRLHELVVLEHNVFFTMELIPGTDLLSYVRGGVEDGQVPNLTRVRVAFRQLVDGLAAIHQFGKLHRDIKPSNIRVTPEGRVVLLDFGVVRESSAGVSDSTLTGQIVGTPAYMSPEQAYGKSLGPPSDLYAVGVVLYRALTGRLPFPTRGAAVLVTKQIQDPPPPREHAPAVPRELDEICMRLLSREPDERATGADLLEVLGLPKHSPRKKARDESLFVGRNRELAVLDDAMEATARGDSITVHVRGRSGMGKTALLRRFLGSIGGREDVVVLAGRCFDRESVPYKGVDSLIDSLSRFLARLPPEQAAGLMPRDVRALARLFPVLERVDVVASSPSRGLELLDPQDLRRRAIAALKELFGRIGDRRLLVVHIDDLQWGDGDSATILRELLRPPDPPNMLLVLGFRDENLDSNAPLLAITEPVGDGRDVREIDLGQLSDEEASKLVQAMLPDDAKADVETIVSSAAGNPFYLRELARSGRDPGTTLAPDSSGTSALDDVVVQRLGELGSAERHLLEVVAVASGPLKREVAYEAAELDPGSTDVVGRLQSDELLRMDEVTGEESLEAYHDRIREAVIANLDATRLRDLHLRLAAVLEAAGNADPERLAEHFGRGGDSRRAGEFAEQAAEQAMAALAFERAAQLFRLALEVKPDADPSRTRLQEGLADALASAGRARDAADIYLALVPTSSGARTGELQRRAATELLRAGHIREGIDAVGGVLQSVGFRMPPTRARALFELIIERARIWMRGLGYRERKPEDIPALAVERIDVCWSVASGLAGIDNIRAGVYQSRHLRLALETGEPHRVARALAFEALFAAQSKRRGLERALELVRAGEELATKLDDPHALALSKLMAGASHMMCRSWEACRDRCREAEPILLERCRGVIWERVVARQVLFTALFHLGQLAEFCEQMDPFVTWAESRGDRYAVGQIATLASLARLMPDDVTGARALLSETVDKWEHGDFSVPLASALMTRTQIALYEGAGREAYANCEELWPRARNNLLFFIDFLRLTALDHRGRAAVAAAADGAPELLRVAARDAKAVRRAKRPGCDAAADVILAGIAVVEGRKDAAATLYRRAVDGFEAASMSAHAAAARHRHGTLIGGDAGKDSIARAERFLRGQGVEKPERFVAMLAPC